MIDFGLTYVVELNPYGDAGGTYCVCGHLVGEHQTGEGPFTGFCYGDPDNSCKCEAFELYRETVGSFGTKAEAEAWVASYREVGGTYGSVVLAMAEPKSVLLFVEGNR